VPTIAEMIQMNTNHSIHLGVLMELHMSDREDMGTIHQHPEVHLSDGFQIDPDRILSEPHKTEKYKLKEQLKNARIGSMWNPDQASCRCGPQAQLRCYASSRMGPDAIDPAI
jgi:hypothetical protein